MNKSQPNQNVLPLNPPKYGIIVLTVLTAFIHLFLSFQFPDGPDAIFLLNGLGYLALVAALYLPISALMHYRLYVRWLLLGYTALTVILWFRLGASTAIAYTDKVIEIGLIVLLWLEHQRSTQP